MRAVAARQMASATPARVRDLGTTRWASAVHEHSVAFLSTDRFTLAPELRRAWDRLDSQNGHVYAMYQSSPWWEHLQATGQGPATRVAVVRNAHGGVDGIVPIRIDTHPLSFGAGRRFGLQVPLRTACILGGEPLIPDGVTLRDQLLKSIWEEAPEVDAIYMKGVSTAGRFWSGLQRPGRSEPGATRRVRKP